MSVVGTPIAYEYHAYIEGSISEHKDYQELLHLLRAASPSDVIYIHLNTPGGSLDITVDIVHNIARSNATVIGCADGAVYSGGSLIFFACNGWEVGDYSQAMLHDGSEGYIGKISENAVASTASAKRIQKLYKDIYGPFLSKRELKELLKGVDIYLDSDEIVKRLENAMEVEDEGEQN